MSQYKTAVIGAGKRSVPHIEAYRHTPEARCTAVCDIDAEKAGERASRFSLTPYTDPAAMVEAEKPDLVHIVTWPDVRPELIALVADMGVPACTTEKPLAKEVRDWRKLREVEQASKTKFGVCHQFRWHPDLARCIEAANSGELGRPRLIDMSAGMNLSAQGTHILHYGKALNADEPVVRVFGSVSGSRLMHDEHPAPVSSIATVEFANGVRGVWHTGPTAPNWSERDEEWSNVRVGAYFDNGRVEWGEFTHWEIVTQEDLQRGHWGGNLDEAMRRNLIAQAGFHRAMFRWLEDDDMPAPTSLAVALEEWRTVLALYASALWRRPVEMDGFEPPEDLYDQLEAALKAAEEESA